MTIHPNKTDLNVHVLAASVDAERKSFVREWIAKAQRRFGAGALGGTLFTLPFLAEAQAAEGAVSVNAVGGVARIDMLEDGSARLTLANGRQVLVGARDITVLPGGEIALSQNAADVIAEIAAQGGIAGAGAGGAGLLGGLAAVAGAGAAAGGGGGGGGGDSPATLNRAALSEGLSSANTNFTAPVGTTEVTLAIDGQNFSATLDANGVWALPASAPGGGIVLPQGLTEITITAKNALGNDLGISIQMFNIDTVAPVINITTLSAGDVLNAAEQGQPLTISGTTDAENGRQVSVGLNGVNYTTTVAGGAFNVAVPAANLAALTNGATLTVTANVADAAGNPAAQASTTFTTDFAAPAISIDPISGGDLTAADRVGGITVTGTTTAEDGQSVTLSFAGQNFTVAANGGIWSVALSQAFLETLGDGTLTIPVSAAISDAAGNPAAAATTNLPADFTGPSIMIATLATDNVVNIIESGNDLTISGSTGNVEAGQVVTVSLDGTPLPGPVTVQVDGTWSVTVAAADVVAFGTGATIAVAVSVTDVVGLPASNTGGFTTDFVAPIISLDALPVGAVLNAAEQGQPLVISGATDAGDGQQATVGLNGVNYSATVAGGVFSVTVPAANLATLADGASLIVTANVIDAAGNPAPQASATFTTDFAAPAITIDALPTGAVLNAAEQGQPLTISGTSTAEAGQPVTLTLNGTALTGPILVTGAGTWATTIPAATLGALPDGTAINLTANVADAAGNPAIQASTGFTTDFTAPSISIDALPVGPVLDIIEQGQPLIVSGTTNAENGQQVTLTMNAASFTTTAAGGAWSITIPAVSLAGMNDLQSFDLVATVTDLAGNPGTSAPVALATDFKPIITLNGIGDDGALILANIDPNNTIISGTTLGVEDGQLVAVVGTSNGGAAFSGTATVTGGIWFYIVPFANAAVIQAGDQIDITASVSNLGGRAATPVSETVFGYETGALVLEETGSNGADISLALFGVAASFPTGLDALDVTISADAGAIVYGTPFPTTSDPGFSLLIGNSANGSISGSALTPITDFTNPLLNIGGTVQNTSAPLTLNIATGQGGSSQTIIGSGGADTIVAGNVDTVLRGHGGDDIIDVSGAGVNHIVFEASPAANGTDTVTGFTLGANSTLADQISFVGLAPADLRGAGTDAQGLTAGAIVGADTGFVVFTTALGGATAGDLATAVGADLSGLGTGDTFYLLAGDGSDAALAEVTVNAVGPADVTILANFTNIGDLSGVTGANILGFDTTGF